MYSSIVDRPYYRSLHAIRDNGSHRKVSQRRAGSSEKRRVVSKSAAVIVVPVQLSRLIVTRRFRCYVLVRTQGFVGSFIQFRLNVCMRSVAGKEFVDIVLAGQRVTDFLNVSFPDFFAALCFTLLSRLLPLLIPSCRSCLVIFFLFMEGKFPPPPKIRETCFFRDGVMNI